MDEQVMAERLATRGGSVEQRNQLVVTVTDRSAITFPDVRVSLSDLGGRVTRTRIHDHQLAIRSPLADRLKARLQSFRRVSNNQTHRQVRLALSRTLHLDSFGSSTYPKIISIIFLATFPSGTRIVGLLSSFSRTRFSFNASTTYRTCASHSLPFSSSGIRMGCTCSICG